jgi:hypothetical protein
LLFLKLFDYSAIFDELSVKVYENLAIL